jgi:hypothetical protein
VYFAEKKKHLRRVVVDRKTHLENLTQRRTSSVPEQVAFRLDLSAFMSTLTGPQRELAGLLAAGRNPTRVAREIGKRPNGILNRQRDLRRKWEQFCGAVETPSPKENDHHAD